VEEQRLTRQRRSQRAALKAENAKIAENGKPLTLPFI